MILDNIKNASRYDALHPGFSKVFQFIQSADLQSLPLGRIELDGENLFINHIKAKAVAESEQVMEIHQNYIDIHFLIEGNERMIWKETAMLEEEIQAYCAEKECALYGDKATSVVDILPNQFVIVYPEDAHGPLIGDGEIHKMIAKVKI